MRLDNSGQNKDETEEYEKNQVLQNLDEYDTNIYEEELKEEVPVKKDVSKFIIHKRSQNKNIWYRDKQDNPCYIMYDDNYSSIEYDLENNIVTCYGDNNKPCFVHSLNDDVQTWFEYDYNDNILYSYNSKGKSYINFYTYYGELIIKEKFYAKLIKDIKIDGDSKIIQYKVDEKERKYSHDGVVLTLEYEDDELISYKSAFCSWEKVYAIDQESGNLISYIKVSHAKDFIENSKQEIDYKDYNLNIYNRNSFQLGEKKPEYETYNIEIYIYDDKKRIISGIEGSLYKFGGERHREVTYIYDDKENKIIKDYGYYNEVEYTYDQENNLIYEYDKKKSIRKYYNAEGILVKEYRDTDSSYDKEYDDDGYLTLKSSTTYDASNIYDGGFGSVTEEYTKYKYNDNKVIIYKEIYDENKKEIFKYNDNGMLIYHEERKFNSYERIKRMHIYEYDDKDRLTYECLKTNEIVQREIFKKYHGNKVKTISITKKKSKDHKYYFEDYY